MDKLLLAIDGHKGKIILEHVFFGKEIYRCDRIKIIGDEDRIGVCVNGHDAYLYRNNVKSFNMDGNTYVLSDWLFTITIIVNK